MYPDGWMLIDDFMDAVADAPVVAELDEEAVLTMLSNNHRAELAEDGDVIWARASAPHLVPLNF